ncbi:HNH endonuclease [bacterium]|nr:HNH endonuclease [bacterium]
MKALKSFRSFVFVLALVSSVLVSASDKFPMGPNPNMTPGSICEDSPVRRYPENIVYCERDVDTNLKKQIIKEYDEELGFSIRQMSRNDFKIDHFIPLSIGGSNSKSNLWPQHKSVYEVTDPLEHLLSEKIVAGLIKQADAIRVIREAKLNLGRVPELIHYVEGL